jgi:putative FmdB family regulatory protein
MRLACITVEGVSMPTYEYHCQHCDRTFDVHLSLEEGDSEHIECPHCKETNVEQVISPFVAVTSKKS